MSDSKRISLSQQIEAVDFALRRQQTLARGGQVRGMRGRSTEEYDLDRLAAARQTLGWLATHEGEIRQWLALKASERDGALAMAREPQRPVAAAEAGVPPR